MTLELHVCSLITDTCASDVKLYNSHHNAVATSEMAVALFLAAAKRVPEADKQLRLGDWRGRGFRSPDRRIPQMMLQRKTALVLGYGNIGRRVARVLSALGMKVVATRRNATEPRNDDVATVHPAGDLHALLPSAHALIICVPGVPSTANLIAGPELALLPHGAVIVNVGRGSVVCEDDLYEALSDPERGLAAGQTMRSPPLENFPIDYTDGK